MSDTDKTAAQDLASLKLPELRKLAAERGLRGVSGLRKGDLITALTTGQVPARGAKAAAEGEAKDAQPRRAARKASRPAGAAEQASEQSEQDKKRQQEQPQQQSENARKGEDGAQESEHKGGHDEQRYESRSQARRARRNRARRQEREAREESKGNGNDNGAEDNNAKSDNNGKSEENQSRGGKNSDNGDHGNGGNGNNGGGNNGGGNNNRRDNHRNDDDNNGGGGRRNRRNRRNRRGRDRDGGGNGGNDLQIREGDEVQVVGGILEVVDNNVAFLRTTGYRAASSDVFVNNNLVRRLGLRSGDALTGKVKVSGPTHTHGNGRNRRKYNQLVEVDTVNGLDPSTAKERPDFAKLTPLYPNQRLRLETDPKILTTRVIDLIMPIGKGQRALIVSPPKAGKTTILQNIANAIATNNPECYLMVVLVDERPEEVTDMQRSVNGEVIASTFDRPPSEHTSVAELAIERAKRLVEQGKDVVVLLDSITRLGRAYNNSSPASGRILSGGVDSNALYPPKRFLGAARNIENGGSLTIIATAMVETGSTGDTVIFEEFKGLSLIHI